MINTLIPMTKTDLITEMVRKIRAYDEIKKGGLEVTIISYVENRFNLRKVSEDLHVHRNTVRNRIEFLEDICGPQINEGENFVRVYMELINARS